MRTLTDRFKGALFAIAVTAAMLCATVEPSAAAFVLKLEDITDGPGGAYGAVIPDGGIGDVHGDPGVIVFNGAIFKPGSGRNFNVNVTTGISKPALPTAPGIYSELDLNSVNVAASGGGTLRITLIDTDFTGGGLGSALLANFGGTLTGGSGSNIVAQSWVNVNNLTPDLGPATHPAGAVADTGTMSLPGNSTVFVPAFTSGPGAFSGSGITVFNNPNGTYSLFAQVTISFVGGGGLASFDFDSMVVPQPAALSLLALGLVAGLGAARRRTGRSGRD